jgi:hypothetical protein
VHGRVTIILVTAIHANYRRRGDRTILVGARPVTLLFAVSVIAICFALEVFGFHAVALR